MMPEEWERCDDPARMLEFLMDAAYARDRTLRKQFIPRDTGRVGDRQVRLFAAACCRQLWPVLTDERSRGGVEGAERCGEDSAMAWAMEALWQAAGEATGEATAHHDDHRAAAQAWLDTGAGRGGAACWRAALAGEYAAHAALCATATAGHACRAWRGEARDWLAHAALRSGAWACGIKTVRWASVAAVAWSEDVDAGLVAGWLVGQRGEIEEILIAARRPTNAVQANLLRDIVGSPFRPRPVIAPAVLDHNGGAALRIAEVIYEGRCFHELPVLADALEEAGCADADLIGHLRGRGPHTLGCWALDLILAKE
jgi:hypothetical protein